jgi:hypothetical protein
VAAIPLPWRQIVVPLDGVQKVVFGYLRTDACLDTTEEATGKSARDFDDLFWWGIAWLLVGGRTGCLRRSIERRGAELNDTVRF